MPRNRFWMLLVCAGLFAGAALIAWIEWGRGKAPIETAKSTPTTVYRNAVPGAKYVGDEVCAQCHVTEATTYRRHPMGRTLQPVSGGHSIERYEAAAHNPFESLGFQFAVERRGAGVIHKARRLDSQGRVAAERETPVEFAIGSGRHGRSYLINRDGYVFESPISWFTQHKGWDLSPVFESIYPPERVIEVSCLFCHSNAVELIPNTLNHYRQPIFRGYAVGCERCHGPGELHVASREQGEIVPGSVDDTIVNPRHLSPVLRESVCQQCHAPGMEHFLRQGRQPFDFRPGLPLYDFWAIFVKAPESSETQVADQQVEQMYQSRCFKASAGKLGCISCHDPHVLPDPNVRVEYYARRCQECHEVLENGGVVSGGVVNPNRVAEQQDDSPLNPQKSALPNHSPLTTHQSPQLDHSPLTTQHSPYHHSPTDDCISCHMPRAATADIAHTAVTDHRIPRRPQRAVQGRRPSLPPPGVMPIVNFYEGLLDPQDPQVKRDLGVALSHVARKPGPMREQICPVAISLLEEVVQNGPDDDEARESLGWVLQLEGRTEEALACYDRIVTQVPDRELTLSLAASLAEKMERPELAIAYLRRAIVVNPWMWHYHYTLAKLLAQRKDWHAALTECEKALPLNPGNEPTRLLLTSCCLHCGQPDRAKRELELLVSLNPKDQSSLRSWFSMQLP